MLNVTIVECLPKVNGKNRGEIVESLGYLYYIPNTNNRSNSYVIPVIETKDIGFEYGTFVRGHNNIYILDYTSKVTVRR